MMLLLVAAILNVNQRDRKLVKIGLFPEFVMLSRRGEYIVKKFELLPDGLQKLFPTTVRAKRAEKNLS